MCPPPPTREITLCYVTDRKGLEVSPENQCEALVGRMEIAARAGVDWIQLREKDLSGRALAELLREALRRTILCFRGRRVYGPENDVIRSGLLRR